MEEVSSVPTAPPESVGGTLREARERHGLSLSEIASRTRVPLRHLEAIEGGSYASLPSSTYATGFVKAYARIVGVDEVAITRRVRGELASSGPRPPEYQPYEAPDPSRVPSRGLTIVTLGIALAAIVLLGLWYGGVLNRPDAPTALTPVAVAAADEAPPTPAPSVTPVAVTGGQVSLQVVDRAWLRVHDGDRTLYLGTMSPGERFDVPADAQNPLVDVGRPEQLRVTLNGSALPALPASGRAVKDLRISAAAVSARLNGTAAPLSDAASAPSTAPVSSTVPGPSAAVAAPTPRRAASVPPRPARRPLDETARANLEAAREAPRAGNAQ